MSLKITLKSIPHPTTASLPDGAEVCAVRGTLTGMVKRETWLSKLDFLKSRSLDGLYKHLSFSLWAVSQS